MSSSQSLALVAIPSRRVLLLSCRDSTSSLSNQLRLSPRRKLLVVDVAPVLVLTSSNSHSSRSWPPTSSNNNVPSSEATRTTLVAMPTRLLCLALVIVATVSTSLAIMPLPVEATLSSDPTTLLSAEAAAAAVEFATVVLSAADARTWATTTVVECATVSAVA